MIFPIDHLYGQDFLLLMFAFFFQGRLVTVRATKLRNAIKCSGNYVASCHACTMKNSANLANLIDPSQCSAINL